MKLETMQHVCYALTAVALAAGSVEAQDGSLFLQPAESRQGLTLQNSSYIHLDLPPEARPRELDAAGHHHGAESISARAF